jgi:N-methylhydantoinase A
MDPAYFLGGLLSLDADAARRAFAGVAERLAMSVEEAAYAALTIATENVIGAIREITIAQGIDPREYALVAGGGASGLNVVPIARELGSKRVLLPSTAGALSACGALFSDVISEFSRSRYAETRTLDLDAVNEVLADIEARADAFLADFGDIEPVATRTEFTVEARYRAQIWELDVPIPSRIDAAGISALEDAFHETHERVFAVREPGQYLECLLWKVRATAVPHKPGVYPRTRGEGEGEGEPQPALVAPAYFRETGLVPVPSYDGVSLPRGARIEGPALIREPTTTVVVYPGSTAALSALGNYLLEVHA